MEVSVLLNVTDVQRSECLKLTIEVYGQKLNQNSLDESERSVCGNLLLPFEFFVIQH